MGADVLEIRDCFGENFPLLPLERTRDALASYAQVRWPASPRRMVAREWELSDDEARSVVTGRASWATFDKIINHKRGGWAVLFPVFGALLDQSAEQFIQDMRKDHAERAKRLGALVGDWWPMPADRAADPANSDNALAERPRTIRARNR